MNTKIRLYLMLLLIGCACSVGYGYAPIKWEGDTIPCLLELELEQLENGTFVVSMTPDTTWEFPNNVVSTAQFTLKATAGQLEIGTITNLIESVVFFEIGSFKSPTEAPEYDYFSIGLGSQGTSDIPFQKGQKVALFSFTNNQPCTNGTIRLMDNHTDPYRPPNMDDANVGQQLTAAGYSLADVPIQIKGEGIRCGSGSSDTSDLSIQLVKQNIICNGDQNGLVIAKASGGTAPYAFLWNTGDTLSTIENLDAGTYQVTVTDAVGAMKTVTVILEVPPVLNLSIQTASASSIMEMDGSAIPTVSGGVAPYRYQWSNGSTEAEQNSLAAGTYTLTITDENGCTIQETIMINALDCPTIDIRLDMKSPICTGDSTGALRVIPLTGTAPFTFLWETGDTTDNLNDIPTGNYSVTITDSTGCSMNLSTFLPDAPPITIDFTVESENGTSNIITAVRGGNLPYTYAWNNGSDNPNLMNVVDGIYELRVTDANGCTEITSVIVNMQACTLDIFGQFGEKVLLDSINCESEGHFCLPFSIDSLRNYTVLLDGTAYTGNLAACDFDTLFAYTYITLPGRGDLGPYVLEKWQVNGQTFSGQIPNIPALVDSMNTWDATGNWRLIPGLFIIEGGDFTKIYGEMDFRTPSSNSMTTLDLNTNLTPNGVEINFSAGMHELVLIDTATLCVDTLLINQPCTDFILKDTLITITVLVGEQMTYGLRDVFGDGLEISENTCSESSDGNASLKLNDNQIASIEGLIEGIDNFCYTLITSQQERIDLTFRVIVTTVHPADSCKPFIELDTFATQVTDCQNFDICVPLVYDSLLKFTITDNGSTFSGLTAACDNDNGSLWSFGSPKTHQLIFTDSANCQDTLLIAIHAPQCDNGLLIEDTVEVLQTKRTCIELAGMSSPFSTVLDICPEKNGEMAILTIDGLTGCLEYTGVELGTDSACIEICNIYGQCDTIDLIIHVVSSDLPPPDFVAVDDTTQTNINKPIVFNALGNDVFTSLDDMYLVGMPQNGMAIFNMDGTIRYVPEMDYCNDTIPDTFQYAICFEGVCDTATVTAFVSCTESRAFIIYTGISPNGDGINDVFQIDGIEDFPNNKVQIYNRWGNIVYNTIGYKNTWDGVWGPRGALLPDGTYFFIFDTGEGDTYNGFLEIKR